jgi:protein-disulfide isomerase
MLLAVGAGAGAWAVAWSLGDEPAGPAPAEVVALRRPDRVTIVEVVDFHCEHCRQMHNVLDRLEDEFGDRVYRVCVSVPLPGQPRSRDAARAFVCACRQGREKEMARALFATWKPDARTCRSRADALGLSMPAYDACLADPAVDRELERQQAWVKAASPRGLPAVWIQDEFFQGVQPLEKLRAVVRRAERQRPSPR